MLKLYRKSQEAQLNWIRKHPFQYVALNVIVFVVGLGFVEIWDRWQTRKFENENPIQES